MKILYVEDNVEVANTVSLFLRAWWPGAEVLRVWDGTSAIEAFEEEDPDLVILDLSLPDVSGYTVLNRFRAASSVPIIVLSGGDAEEETRALGAGADDYVSKPCVGTVLQARIQALLRHPRLAPSPQQHPARALATHTFEGSNQPVEAVLLMTNASG